MSDQLRARLHEMMAAEPRPPVDGLVHRALVHGAATRRRRRLASGAGTAAVVAAVAAVVTFGGVLTPNQAGSGSSTAGSSPTSVVVTLAPTVNEAPAATQAPAVASVTPVQELPAPAATSAADKPAAAPAPVAGTTAKRDAQIRLLTAKLIRDQRSGSSDVVADKERLAQLEDNEAQPVVQAKPLASGVPATPTGMLELLTSQLPAGSTSHAAVAEDGTSAVELYVNTPTGPGMVRVFLHRDPYVPAGCGDDDGCSVEPNGDFVLVSGLADNCIETQSVTVIHPDGSNVTISLSTCLQWDGKQNAPSPAAMTIEQATAIATDPRWDVSMDPALVTAGAAHFPSPLQFG